MILNRRSTLSWSCIYTCPPGGILTSALVLSGVRDTDAASDRPILFRRRFQNFFLAGVTFFRPACQSGRRGPTAITSGTRSPTPDSLRTTCGRSERRNGQQLHIADVVDTAARRGHPGHNFAYHELFRVVRASGQLEGNGPFLTVSVYVIHVTVRGDMRLGIDSRSSMLDLAKLAEIERSRVDRNARLLSPSRTSAV